MHVEVGRELLLPFERSFTKRTFVLLQVQVDTFLVRSTVLRCTECTSTIATCLSWSSL